MQPADALLMVMVHLSIATVVIAGVIGLAAVVAAFVIGIDAGASAVADKWLQLHPEDEGVRLNDTGSSRLQR
jgi:hypothetical protein